MPWLPLLTSLLLLWRSVRGAPAIPSVASCPVRCTCGPLDGLPVPVIDCSKRRLLFVPRRLPSDARTLLLNGNNLTDLYEQFPSLSELRHLNVSRNHLKQLGRGTVFSNFSRLVSLDLSYNDLRTVYNGVFRGLHALRTLLMRNAHVKFVDEHAFDGMDQLQELDLSANELHSVFPEWFMTLRELRKLDFSHNHIVYLNSGTFGFLHSLRVLRLDGNKIRGIHEKAFSDLKNVTTLRLDGNALQKVPAAAIQSLDKLNTLDLDGNAFSSIEAGDFQHSPLLKELSVSRSTDLYLIDRGAFWDLPLLEELRLHNNLRLQYVDPGAFVELPKLKVLHLHANNLMALSEDLVVGIPGPLQITFYGNPVLCDCNVHWIHRRVSNDTLPSSSPALSSVEFLDVEELVCRHPREVESSPVRSLSNVPSECPPVLVGQRNTTTSKKMGAQHAFQCRAYGLPPPRIHWVLPSGSLLNDTSNSLHLQFGFQGSLSIYHLKPADSGRYTCVASNPHGEARREMQLLVENVDIRLFPMGVSSTFVTVVWNGTARNAFPEYEILYRREGEGQAYKSVTVSQFSRQHTINHLEPESRYQFCLAVRDDEELVQISCTRVKTQDTSFMLQGIQRTSNVAVAAALSVVAAMLVVLCLVTLAARRYRQRLQYETPEKALVENMHSQIPMENLYSPLMTRFGS